MPATTFDSSTVTFDSLTIRFDARRPAAPAPSTGEHGHGELIRSWHVVPYDSWDVSNPTQAWKVKPE